MSTTAALAILAVGRAGLLPFRGIAIFLYGTTLASCRSASAVMRMLPRVMRRRRWRHA